MTLEQIIENEKKHRTEGGEYGITMCKSSINFSKNALGRSYYSQLEEFVKRANEDVFFNKAMILACWELINNA